MRELIRKAPHWWYQGWKFGCAAMAARRFGRANPSMTRAEAAQLAAEAVRRYAD